ncbi:MAG: hypothetical protein KatS3mg035_1165 [Bacteroidia bacterium]|nr:MAG: hypothetical protein KatS3mg035_1165 [Bacteroidia bacterium]
MKIIYTSALIPNKFDVRKTHYQESYNSLLDYFKKDDIYVVECFSDDVSFFNELCASVYITNTHDINIRNKGVLELSGIKKFIDTTKQEDEVFLKLTGRYKLLDNSFIKTIEENKGYDFYGRLVDNKTQVFTGCFAIKRLYFKRVFGICRP